VITLAEPPRGGGGAERNQQLVIYFQISIAKQDLNDCQ